MDGGNSIDSLREKQETLGAEPAASKSAGEPVTAGATSTITEWSFDSEYERLGFATLSSCSCGSNSCS